MIVKISIQGEAGHMCAMYSDHMEFGSSMKPTANPM